MSDESMIDDFPTAENASTWLYQQLSMVENSAKAKTISEASADIAVIQKLLIFAEVMAPEILQDQLSDRVHSLLSDLRDQHRGSCQRARERRGRPPVAERMAIARTTAIAAVEWLVEQDLPVQRAEDVVLSILNQPQSILRSGMARISRSELRRWRHKWLPEQKTACELREFRIPSPDMHSGKDTVIDVLKSLGGEPEECAKYVVSRACLKIGSDQAS